MFEIIPMNYGHLNAVCEIENKCYTQPWSRIQYEEELGKTNAFYYAAVEDGIVIGYTGMWHIINEGHITTLAVSPDKRKSGIGTVLLHELIGTAKKLEMLGLMLEVRINNYDAQRLYMKNGFVLERIRKNYYSDTGEDALVLWKACL
jgi:ribosomal-protein-alanine N-acetyltransferase